MNQKDYENSQVTDTVAIRSPGAIVPPQAVAGRALTFVVAVMSFLACISFGFVTVVWNSANDWNNEIIREVTIQIRPLDGVEILFEVDKAIELSNSVPGVTAARVLSEEETGSLLQPWLGTDFDINSLPIPRIVNVEIGDPELVDLNFFRELVKEHIRGGSLDDHSRWASRLAVMANVFILIGMGILVLVLVSMILCVVFATRAAMAGNKDVISVLHFVGANEKFIASEFQGHFLYLGLLGGVIGGLSTVVVLVLLEIFSDGMFGGVGEDQFAALFGNVSLDYKAYVGIATIVALVTALTSITSRLAVNSQMRNLK